MSRRKPSRTYRSPVPGIFTRRRIVHNLPSAKIASQPTNNVVVKSEPHPRKTFPLAPKLPLYGIYHPLGQMALSVEPLDPAIFGHSFVEEEGSRRSGRTTNEEHLSVSGVVAIAAVAAREVANPKKPRRSTKRRRDEDEYQAKRSSRRQQPSEQDVDLEET